MKILKCDVCGKDVVSYYNLTALYDHYQTDKIKDVCDECGKEIRNAIDRVKEALKPVESSWIKKVICQMVEMPK